MKAFLLALLLGLPGPFALAEDNDQIAEEMAQLHQELAGAVKQIQEKAGDFQSGPVGAARARMLQLASDDRFLQAALDLWAHPKRKTLLISQAIFFALMFLFKAWRQSAAKNWFKKILVGIFLGTLTWVGLIFVLPYAFLGEPFRYFVFTLWRVLVTG